MASPGMPRAIRTAHRCSGWARRCFACISLQPPPIHAFDPWQVAQDYLGRIPGGAAALPAGPLSRLHAVCAGLAAEPAVSIVHGDLAQGNLLEGSRLWLLDWEYAQRSEALMDLACVLAYYPQRIPIAGIWPPPPDCRRRDWMAPCRSECRSIGG